MDYPKSAINKLNRKKERGAYDTTTIHTIIKQTDVVHVSFTPASVDEFPVILPMIGQLGSFENPSADLSDPLDLYLHGYVSSRIMNIARDPKTPLKVCVCATKQDGIILALTPNSHSYNYRSAVVFGTAELVEDRDEKLFAMELITDGVVRGRWAESRIPPDEAEMQSTSILKVTIESASAKKRVGGPSDYPKDLKRDDVMDKVWVGVVPAYQVYGEPIAGEYNRVKDVPKSVTEFIKVRNEEEREYAIAAVTMTAAPKKD